ncbi:MAG: primase [Planctomycetota bacterium]|jgi:DNA primase
MSATNDRDRVLAATDILSVIGEVVALRPKGREHVGLCPFHDDRSPSMAVVTHKSAMGGNGFYKCFACGAAGNAIDFVINYHKMEFPEALRFLAGKAGVELTPWEPRARGAGDGEPTRDEVLRANAMAWRYYRKVLADPEAGAKARAEAARRGYDEAVLEGFGLGASPDRFDAMVEGVRKAVRSGGADYPPFAAFVAAGVIREGRNGGHVDLLRNRLVFPILDELGRPIAFGGRKLDPEQEPKYLNSPESPVFHKSRALYGIHAAKRPIIEKGEAIITEGYTDVIACHRAGFTNAVATLGTSLTTQHARLLRRLGERVVLLFDGDEAGQKAADRAIEVFFAEPIDIRICVLPDGLDPDDLLRSEGGADRFTAALAASEDALPFMAKRIAQRLSGRGLSGRQQVIEQTVQKFVDLGLNAMGGLRRQLVFQTMAELFGLQSAELERLARSLRPRGTGGERISDEPPSVASPTNAGEPIEPSGAMLEVAPGDAARRRARVEAERRLLALLCVEPGAASVAVPVEGCGTLPLSEALSPAELADRGHSAIFAAIRDAAEAARNLSFDALLADIDSPPFKSLASDLYLFGTELLRAAAQSSVGGARTPAEEILDSWRDLEDLERRQRFRTSAPRAASPNASSSEDPHDPTRTANARVGIGVESSPPAANDAASAQERLARLRERGHDATAVTSLFRRRPTPTAEPGRSSQP